MRCDPGEAAHAERELAEPSRVTFGELADLFVELQDMRIRDGRIHRRNGDSFCYAAQALVAEAEHPTPPVNRFRPKALQERSVAAVYLAEIRAEIEDDLNRPE